MKRLEVDAKEFKALMKRVSISKRNSAHELATIAFRKGFGELEVGATTLMFHADGDWKGQATFTAAMLVAVREYPPSGDPIVIEYADEKITIGNFKMGATWHTAVAKRIVIPDEADWPDVLLATLQMSKAQALLPTESARRRAAYQELNKRIARAASELAPLGITQSDLRALIEVRFLENKE